MSASSPSATTTTPFLHPIHFTTTLTKWAKTAPESDQFKKLLIFLKVADNKDKLLKILQYICKFLVVSKLSLRQADLKSFTSTLSLARKLGRLGNWLPAVEELYELSRETHFSLKWTLQMISAAASLGNDLLDDWICLQKGCLLVKQPYLDMLDTWSIRLWFVSVSVDLHFALQKLKLSSEEEMSKRMDAALTVLKLGCDWLFCFWDIADLSARGGAAEYVPVLAGLSAAGIGAIRGWRKIK